MACEIDYLENRTKKYSRKKAQKNLLTNHYSTFYRKTIENIRKHINFNLIYNRTPGEYIIDNQNYLLMTKMQIMENLLYIII